MNNTRMILLLVLSVWLVLPAQAEKIAFSVFDVQHRNLVGQLYVPELTAEMPAVVVLGGSSGRLNENHSEMLASNGIVAFSLAYFSAEGLSATLDEVPVELVSQAIEYLDKHKYFKASRFGVLGVSRGAELALLAATQETKIQAVVGLVPSSVAWHGQTGEAAWTVNKRAVPTLSFDRHAEESLMTRVHKALADTQKREQASIPVEHINGAVLLVSAKHDHIWPSEWMAKQMIQRLKDKGFAHPYQHIAVDDNHFLDDDTIKSLETTLVNTFRGHGFK